MMIESETRATRIMWQTVILRAVQDAIAKPTKVHNGATTSNLERDKAHRWLTDMSRDFREVCELAGMNAEQISTAYKEGRFTAASLRNREAA